MFLGNKYGLSLKRKRENNLSFRRKNGGDQRYKKHIAEQRQLLKVTHNLYRDFFDRPSSSKRSEANLVRPVESQ